VGADRHHRRLRQPAVVSLGDVKGWQEQGAGSGAQAQPVDPALGVVESAARGRLGPRLAHDAPASHHAPRADVEPALAPR
jgi:hypothetical protein